MIKNKLLQNIKIFLLLVCAIFTSLNLQYAMANNPTQGGFEPALGLDNLKAAMEDAKAMGNDKDPSLLHFQDLNKPGSVARLKDISSIENVRPNQLVGYGLVVGLNGTGDSLRNSPFTEQSMRAMLENLGISPPPGATRANNIAAVIVTADLPPFAREGISIDVSVASLGDAKSLQGGSLVMTPLLGADGNTYAVAQGRLVVSGYSAQGRGQTVTKGVPTSARIPNGATVEKELPGEFNDLKELKISLHDADFTTAARVCDLVNLYSKTKYAKTVADVLDSRTIQIVVPSDTTTTKFIAAIENLPIPVDEVAKVVVDERTGTVVIGEKVRISRVAISHGSLTVKVNEEDDVVQPLPFGNGDTVVLARTGISTKVNPKKIGIFSGTSLDKLVKGLNQIGVKPADIIAILQAIKSAGALHADLVVQ